MRDEKLHRFPEIENRYRAGRRDPRYIAGRGQSDPEAARAGHCPLDGARWPSGEFLKLRTWEDAVQLLGIPTLFDMEWTESEEAWMEYQETGRTTQCRLRNQVQMWPTPTQRDYKGARKPETLATVGRTETNSLPDAVMEKNGGSLNAEWVCWLMGFPPGWANISE
jgi:hypothetical protein